MKTGKLNTRFTLVLALILVISLCGVQLVGATGVSEQQAPGAAIEAVDALGRSVTLDGRPERIAVVGKATMIVADGVYLFPEARKQVTALGLTNQGLGDFYQHLAPEIPTEKRTAHNAGAEQIAALGPDLVMIKSYLYDGLGKQLEMLGIPVFTVSLESPADYVKEIEQMGILFDEQERSEQIITFYQNQLDLIQRRTENVDPKRVLLLYAATRDGVTAFQTAPNEWMQTFMAREAGAIPVWEDSNLTSGWQKVGIEQIAAWDPEHIYIISYRSPAPEFVEMIKSDKTWQQLSAIKNGNIKPFPADYHNWAQPDTRWILGLSYLAADLYPEQFPEFTPKSLIREFYQKLYQITDESVIEDIISKYEDSLGR
jgi:iron complex transport system substrate-binding protein